MTVREALETARYLAYLAGWRHAPRLLRRVERVGHRARNRLLRRRLFELALGSSPPVSIEVVGWDPGFAGDVAHGIQRALRAPLRDTTAGHVRARDVTPSLDSTADLLLVEVPDWRASDFAREGFLVLPKRVTHLEPLDRPEPRFAARLRRAAAREGLGHRVSTARADVEEFHRALYLPMVERRHGARARPTSLALLRFVLRDGVLVQVFRGAEWLSGAVLARHPLLPHAMSIVLTGVRGGDYDAVGETARLAPVLFARDVARARGATVCDHLVTRAFPRDGLFAKKSRWDTTPADLPERADRVVLAVRRDTPGVRRLLGAYPLLAVGPRGLAGVAFGEVTDEALHALRVPGLSTTWVAGCDGAGSDLPALQRLARSLGS